jgi:cysteine synthase A
MAKNIIDTIGNTPLISLSFLTHGTEAIILGKQESRNPAGSVKCRIAAAMIEAGQKEGKISDQTSIIEPTSGNTGIGLAFVCAQKKLKLILTMPESMSIERRKLLKHLGAELILTPASQGMKGDRKSTRLNSSHRLTSRMPSSA